MEQYLPWLALKSVPGIGNHLIKRLIDRFKSPQLVFQTSYDDLVQVKGMSDRLARRIKKYQIPDDLHRELDQIAHNGYTIVTLTASDYPPLLREIPDPPPYLYVYGRINCGLNAIAVVGSRHATSYGISTTRRLCSDLAALNLIVVSGMAKGIDTAAHEGTLSRNGHTIAVLGSGLDNIYPRENRNLFHRIARQGAVVSEFSLSADPEAHHFPARNRIISGMSLGVVVAEATLKSGSLITARLAAEQNRDVFAIPGSVRSFKSTGTHSLIKQGAKLVEHAQDIVEELAPLIEIRQTSVQNTSAPAPDRPVELTDEESRVLRALEPYPIHIDELAGKISIRAGKLLGLLLGLELKGIVSQSPGKMFSRCDL